MARPGLAAPGPSYLRPLDVSPGEPRRVGMSQPQTMADGWWVALLWCEQDGEVVEFFDFAPANPQGEVRAEAPAASPLQLLGPALSGLLSGLVLARDGRLQLRLRLGRPPTDPTRPWDAPLAVLAAFVFEPARAATMRDTELAETVLRAFRDSLLRLRG